VRKKKERRRKKKKQDENIMVCRITQGDHKERQISYAHFLMTQVICLQTTDTVRTRTLTNPGNHPSLRCRNIHADNVHSAGPQCAQYRTHRRLYDDHRDLGHGRRHCCHGTDMADMSYQAPSGHHSNQLHS